MLSIKGAKKEDGHITIEVNNERKVLEICRRGLKTSCVRNSMKVMSSRAGDLMLFVDYRCG